MLVLKLSFLSFFLSKYYFFFLLYARTTKVYLDRAAIENIWKRRFFGEYFKFLLLGNSNESKTNPKNVFWKYLKKHGC